MRPRWTLVLTLGLCPQALGQLIPVDQGVADLGPLSISHRVAPMDLRVPTNFERVYEGQDAAGARVFFRMNGSLVATFPASIYEPTEWGQLAVIPPGTRYQIGEAPTLFETPTSHVRRSPTAIDRRATPTIDQPPASLWTDESYRASRVRLRLAQAARD